MIKKDILVLYKIHVQANIGYTIIQSPQNNVSELNLHFIFEYILLLWFA